MQFSTRSRGLVAALTTAALAAVPLAATAGTDASTVLPPAPVEKTLSTVPALADPDVGRRDVPEDEFAMALGCYALTNVADGQRYGRTADGYTTAETAFHFEPTQLGQYLLLDDRGDLVAAAGGPAEQFEDAVEDVEYVAPLGRDTHLPRSIDDDAPAPLADDTVGGNTPSVDTHTGAVVPGEAGPSADWRVRQNGDGTFTFLLDAASGRVLAADGGTFVLADAAAAGAAARFTLARADETTCAEWPEIEVNVEGPVLAGATAWDETRGTIDAHLHLMAFEFLGGELRCGRPWHPYGVTEALRNCSQHELTGYRMSESVVGRGPGDGNDKMWPEFTVPQSNTLTYEQVYHRWLERAWRGGLRMMTVLLVDNNSLCELYPYKRNSCNEMDAVRLQSQRVDEFVDFLDARAGGPGEGFAQVATTPFEAREIVNQGRLALVKGIEVSELFECDEYMGTSGCTNADIVRQLDEVQELGIAQMQLVNKFDNALSGVTGDGGQTGIVVNTGNRDETGHYWRMETCPEERTFGADKRQTNLVEEADGTPAEPVARDPLAAMILTAAGTTGAAPLYPAGPHCNTASLTDQGEFILQEMAARGILFDPDHMSARAAERAMDVVEELEYPGVMSSHTWSQDNIYQRVYDLGGIVTPYAGSANGFVNAWRQRLEWVNDDYYFGFGYGADTNGLGGQGGPRNPAEGEPRVEYPFEVAGGALVHQQVSGEREPYDFNTTGTAHYGLYPDWMEDIQQIAGDDGDDLYADMLRGPEAYIQVWERAVGIERNACVFGDGTVDPTDGVRPGMTFEDVLRVAGQPHLREATGYTYCGLNPGGKPTHVVVAFDAATGTVAGTSERPVMAPLPRQNPPRGAAAALAVAGERTDALHAHHEGHGHEDDEHGGEVAAAGDVTASSVAGTSARTTTPTGASGLLALATLLGALGIAMRAGRRSAVRD